MLRITLNILSLIIVLGLHAQVPNLYDEMTSQYQVDQKDITTLTGYLDNALPMTIAYVERDHMLQGLIRYGQDETSHIVEGTATDSLMSFFEFEDATITAVISGPPAQEKLNWNWSTHNFSRTLPIVIHEENMVVQGQVQLYADLSAQDRSQVLLRPDRDHVSIELENSINLRWMDYACEGINCYEGRPDMQLENPIEFTLSDEELVVYPNTSLEKLHEISYETVSSSDASSFGSYSYPIVSQKKFDNWVKQIVTDQKVKVASSVLSTSIDYTDRFKDRSYGDFYITLLSKEIISGYLVFYNNNSNRMETFPFNYNMAEKKFYRMKDFFKNDFDYPFFLKSFIEKKKRLLLYKEDSVIKEMIRPAPFSHYVLAPGGIIFFTDFNTIYGRRNILIPYDEIRSFINDKTLSNYINKDRYR